MIANLVTAVCVIACVFILPVLLVGWFDPLTLGLS